MANPDGTPPTTPPGGGFAGDSLGLTLAASGTSLVVAGTGPTSTGTVLEITAAPLASAVCRAPKSGYVSRGFFSLTAGNDYTVSVAIPAGIYAVRARYVSLETGQATPVRTLGKTTVASAVAGVDPETGEVMAPAPLKKAA